MERRWAVFFAALAVAAFLTVRSGMRELKKFTPTISAAVGALGREFYTPTSRLWSAEGFPLTAVWGRAAPFDHASTVYAVGFYPDGKSAFTASLDGKVKVWELRNGFERDALEADRLGVTCASLSPDGRILAWCGMTGKIGLYDVNGRKYLRTLEGHEGIISAIAFSSDSTRLLSGGGRDRTLRVWDTASGRPLRSWSAGEKGVASVALSPAGGKALSGDGAGAIRLWDVGTGAELSVWAPHADAVYGLAFSTDGSFAASASKDGEVRLWTAADGRTFKKLASHEFGARAVSFSGDGRFLAAGGEDRVIRLWDAKAGSLVREWTLQAGSGISSLAFSPDNRRLLAGHLRSGTGKGASLLNVDGGVTDECADAHCGSIDQVVVSADGAAALSRGDDGTVRLWNAKTGDQIRVLRKTSGNKVAPLSLTADGSIGSAPRPEGVDLWRLPSGTGIPGSKALQASALQYAGVSPDGKVLVTMERSGFARKLWALPAGRLLQDLDAYVPGDLARFRDPVGQGLPIFSADGSRLFGFGGSGEAVVWDAGGLSLGHYPLPPSGKIFGHGFLSPRRPVLLLQDRGSLALWDVEASTPIARFPGSYENSQWSDREIRAAAFSPDGRWLAFSYLDAIEVWDTASAGRAARLPVENLYVTSISFPAGEDWFLASTSVGYILKFTRR